MHHNAGAAAAATSVPLRRAQQGARGIITFLINAFALRAADVPASVPACARCANHTIGVPPPPQQLCWMMMLQMP